MKVINKERSIGQQFLRSATVLASGTAIAQLIGILTLPIITRLYTPEDFTGFAIFNSLLAICAVVCCLRLEIAIPIPEKLYECKNLLKLSLFFSILMSLIITIFLLLFDNWLIKLLNNKVLESYLYLLPLITLLTGMFNAYLYFSIKEKKFLSISKVKVAKILFGSVVQILLGFFSFTSFGLVGGLLINTFVGLIYIKKINKVSIFKFRKIKLQLYSLNNTLQSNMNFLKYSTLEGLVNSSASHLPMLIIASLALGSEVGFLLLAMKLLQIPLSLIGRSIGQTYLAHAPKEHLKNNLYAFTTSIAKKLALIGFIPFTIVFIVAPLVIPLIFGKEWERSGVLISWMVPWFYFQFVSSPLSMSLHIIQRQRLAFLLQLIGFILKVLGVVISASYFEQYISETFAISSAIFYLLYIFTILWSVKSVKSVKSVNPRIF